MIHCFYHSADLDGHCSGAIVKYRFSDAIMHPINYGDEFPWNEIKGEDEVYMVDFALQPWTDMERLMQECHLTWIDHHSSSIQSYVTRKPIHKSNCCARYDVTVAACRLTWEYLFPDKPVPLAVQLLSLYDSWTYQGHELEDMVLPFQMRLRMEDLDPKYWTEDDRSYSKRLWVKFFSEKPVWFDGHELSQKEFVETYISEGRLLLHYDEVQKAKYAKTYAFETYLHVPIDETEQQIKDMGGVYEVERFRAIAINLGHTNSKVFDSVWRRECDKCKGKGKLMYYSGRGAYRKPDSVTCDTCNGTGFMPTICQVCEGRGKHIMLRGEFEPKCSTCNGTGYIEAYDLMITFVRRKDKLWNVSLYSTKSEVDCGAIAKSFGGGGHKGAAGFQCKELPFVY